MKKNTILAILALSLMSTGGVWGDTDTAKALKLAELANKIDGKSNYTQNDWKNFMDIVLELRKNENLLKIISQKYQWFTTAFVKRLIEEDRTNSVKAVAEQKRKQEEQRKKEEAAAEQKRKEDEAAAAEKKRKEDEAAAAEQKRKDEAAAAEQKRKQEEQRKKEEATGYFLQKVKGREDKVNQMIKESISKNTLQDMKSYLKQAETFLQDDETYEDLSLNSGVKNLLETFSDQMKEKIKSKEEKKDKKETKKQEEERLRKEKKQAKDLEKAGEKDAESKKEAVEKIQEMTKVTLGETTEAREENSDDYLNDKNKNDVGFDSQNTVTDKDIEDQETDVGTDTEGDDKKRKKRTFDLSEILKKQKYSNDQERDGGTDTKGHEKKRKKRTLDLSEILKKKKYSEDQERDGGTDREGYDGDDEEEGTKKKISLNFNVGSDRLRESNLKQPNPAVIDFVEKFDEIISSSKDKNIVKLKIKKNISSLLEDALSDKELEKEDKKDCIGVIVDGMKNVGVSATDIKNYIDGAVKKTSTPKDYREYYFYNLFVKICTDNGMKDLKLWLPGESIPDYTRSITEQMPNLNITQSKAIVKSFVLKVGPLIKKSHPRTFARILDMLVLNSPLCEKTQSTFEITDGNIENKRLHQLIIQNLKKIKNDIKKYHSQWVSINENKSISSAKKRSSMNLLKMNAKKKYSQFNAIAKELKALIKEDFIRNNYPEEDLKTLELLGTNKELTDISKKLQLEDKKSSGNKNISDLEADVVKTKDRIPAKKKLEDSKKESRSLVVKKTKRNVLELPEAKKPAAKNSAKIDRNTLEDVD